MKIPISKYKSTEFLCITSQLLSLFGFSMSLAKALTSLPLIWKLQFYHIKLLNSFTLLLQNFNILFVYTEFYRGRIRVRRKFEGYSLKCIILNEVFLSWYCSCLSKLVEFRYIEKSEIVSGIFCVLEYLHCQAEFL